MGPLAAPVPALPPPSVGGGGGRIAPAFRLGAGLFPAATRQGQSPSGRRTGFGVHMDAYALSLLARSHPGRCVSLSPGAQASWLISHPQSGKGVLKHRKNTLTAPLRAWVRLGMTLYRRVTYRHSHRLRRLSASFFSMPGGLVVSSTRLSPGFSIHAC